MLDVARAYYLHDRSKVDIARQTGLSRWQVARVLADARDSGLVTIHVADDDPGARDLAGQVRDALGISEVIVVDRGASTALTPSIDAVASGLAEYLSETVRAGETLGIVWSRIVEALPGKLRSMAPCDVVQLAGALTFPGNRVGSVEVIRQVARVAEGTAHPIYAPLVAPTGETAAALRRAPEIAKVLDRAVHADRAVVGIGTWTREGSSILPLLPEELVSATAAAGAAAVISGRVIDADGQAIDVGVDEHILGVSLDQLRGIPSVIGACAGAHRADAVRAAVRGGLVDVLIADEPLARALLGS
ncbi:sugar-binding transcriptional regulator [Brachybacterium sp. GCM10030252]|uniref:sugar-binding transcriptional regulator n=1 Tax=Brachybacterium sp. GCM10030252 TaxID=3273380 RepID=UPI0036142F05